VPAFLVTTPARRIAQLFVRPFSLNWMNSRGQLQLPHDYRYRTNASRGSTIARDLIGTAKIVQSLCLLRLAQENERLEIRSHLLNQFATSYFFEVGLAAVWVDPAIQKEPLSGRIRPLNCGIFGGVDVGPVDENRDLGIRRWSEGQVWSLRPGINCH
jgi:hypothetical protein